MNKLVYAVVVALAAVVGCAAPVGDKSEQVGQVSQALVTFDPATGTGFVGKGDIQLPFGWNNATLQANASSLTFTYQSSATYEAVCEWTTGEGTRGQRTHDVTHTKTSVVNDTISYDARTHKQVDGFFLTGYGSVTEGGEPVPEVGGPCPGNPGTDGVWVSVVLLNSTGGGLWVTNAAGGTAQLL
jgi:hypothetical protein